MVFISLMSCQSPPHGGGVPKTSLGPDSTERPKGTGRACPTRWRQPENGEAGSQAEEHWDRALEGDRGSSEAGPPEALLTFPPPVKL